MIAIFERAINVQRSLTLMSVLVQTRQNLAQKFLPFWFFAIFNNLSFYHVTSGSIVFGILRFIHIHVTVLVLIILLCSDRAHNFRKFFEKLLLFLYRLLIKWSYGLRLAFCLVLLQCLLTILHFNHKVSLFFLLLDPHIINLQRWLFHRSVRKNAIEFRVIKSASG